MEFKLSSQKTPAADSSSSKQKARNYSEMYKLENGESKNSQSVLSKVLSSSSDGRDIGK